MKIDDGKIKEILLREGYVSAADLEKAEKNLVGSHQTLANYLLSQGLTTRNLLGSAIAESLLTTFADLTARPPTRDQVLKIPEELAKKFQTVLVSEKKSEIEVATSDPENLELRRLLEGVFPSKNITIKFAFGDDIQSQFIHYRQNLETRFAKILAEKKKLAPEFIEQILSDTLTLRASDVHLEPQEKDVLIRFRLDGVLHPMGRIPKEYYENILNRVKVLAHLRLDEHFRPQDGAIRFAHQENSADLRVSIVPTLDGEKINLRLLAEYVRDLSLNNLGLSEDRQKSLLEAAGRPFGMILVVGPTGSGKTTTLYSLVKLLNRPEVNIVTIEDPVEYKIENVNQIQVNEQTSLTFAQGLRSIVRQDPNIILVGEIRDRETAEIAVNAALTGHLLLSTFHANDAATAIPRLLEMGVEPFLLASTLNLIISQRLVRRICENCRLSVLPKKDELKSVLIEYQKYLGEDFTSLYKGKGCTACNFTGFKGRQAIFEIINISKKMQDLMLRNPSSAQIWDLARQEGSTSLFEDGIEKVKAGTTTLEELLRVARPQN